LEYWKRGERVPGERREFSENNKYELWSNLKQIMCCKIKEN
jgi:hypothetical protein